MEITFVPSSKIPRPNVTGRKPHPVDVEVSAALRDRPDEWAIYPLDARYPEHTGPEGFTRAVALVRKRFTTWNKADQHGRFETRANPDTQRLYVRYAPHNPA